MKRLLRLKFAYVSTTALAAPSAWNPDLPSNAMVTPGQILVQAPGSTYADGASEEAPFLRRARLVSSYADGLVLTPGSRAPSFAVYVGNPNMLNANFGLVLSFPSIGEWVEVAQPLPVADLGVSKVVCQNISGSVEYQTKSLDTAWNGQTPELAVELDIESVGW